MAEKKVLGVKSYKFILLESIGFVAGTLLSILFITQYLYHPQTYCLVFGILSIVCTIVACYWMIRTIIRPKHIIEYDDYGVYINYRSNKTVFIQYKDIENVFASEASGGHGKIYRFGTITIRTKTNKYEIGIMDNVKDAEKFIYSQIAYKYRHS